VRINPLHAIDAYKTGHVFQYPKGTELVYSNFTARSDKLKNIPTELWTGNLVFFGLQHFIKDFLIDTWSKEFFQKDKGAVLLQHQRRLDAALGKDAVTIEHISALHDLGYLPIVIRALPEGSLVPMRVPCLVLYNTLPEFYWLTNYLETALSAGLWKACTSATVAYHYRLLLEKYAELTGADKGFVRFQGHDFSCRGMSGLHDAALSGAAHLTSFCGTDTILAIDLLEEFYGGKPEKELLGCSVPATEHSVMCMGTKEGELQTFKQLITEIYPKGVVSVVSDTWDWWKVISEYAAQLKPLTMARDGKLVFRPDSGDPVKLLCGDPMTLKSSPVFKGAVEVLWDIFGGTKTKEGYAVLDPHVGLIYGDSITLERAESILRRLKAKGFASSNVVFGIGSFTYQHVTRDTFGFAVKSTYGMVNGEGREIFKDPITDSGVKKSAKGLLKVTWDGRAFKLVDQQASLEAEPDDCLVEVFRDGRLVKEQTIREIRARLGWEA
jgi:nicotinamide phosphoribosyltransferase